MPKTAAEIVALLNGTNAAARFFGVKPPSVSMWLQNQLIPDERLIPFAASIERISGGAFSRRAQWPERCVEIWPELAELEDTGEVLHVVGMRADADAAQGVANG